jgi:hypothetical protein
MGKEMMRYASEGSRRIAHASMRGKHHEVDLLLPRDLEERLPLVDVARDKGAHARIVRQTRAKMIEVPLRPQFQMRSQIAREIEVSGMEHGRREWFRDDVDEEQFRAVRFGDSRGRRQHAFGSERAVEGNENAPGGRARGG